MPDKTANANRFARDPQRRNTAAKPAWMPWSQLWTIRSQCWGRGPIVLRGSRGNYEKGLEETATAVEEQSEGRRRV